MLLWLGMVRSYYRIGPSGSRLMKAILISNLAYISKLTERPVYNQIHDHLFRWNLYPILQSAYRQYYSTETTLLEVLNDILLNMNSQRVTVLVLLDVSSAFDHKPLLERLGSKFGF